MKFARVPASLTRPSLHALAALLLVPGVLAGGQLLGMLSEEEEIELGRLTAEQVESDLVLLTDPLVGAYVSSLGTELASRSDRAGIEYHFKVVDSPEINAFALPGGYIYVNRGLLEAASNESELAGVLGHEIGHVVGRHGAEQAQRASIANLGLRVLDSVFGGGTRGQLGAMAAELAAQGTFMKFSRDAEREADRLGAENVARTGFDPRGMVSFFEVLAGLREGEANPVENFFASHPSPAERVSNVQDLLVSLVVERRASGPDSADAPEFLEVKERLATIPRPDPGGVLLADASRDLAGEGDEPTEDALAEAEVDFTYPGLAEDYEIAARFAPVWHQALGDAARFDYITRFDFDGDWVGDNNWDNAGDGEPALPAVVYFNVSETETHYFIHYAAFHPRDYKGGNLEGVILSEIIREGVGRYGDYDPTGLAESAVLAHENDMEGAMVVAEKAGRDPSGARLVYVETLAHNEFFKYRVPSGFFSRFGRRGGTVRVEGERPLLYIEPRGHGIEAYQAGDQLEGAAGFVVYRYSGTPEEASATSGEQTVGYDLVSMPETIWPRALAGENPTYGGAFDYQSWTVDVFSGESGVERREVVLGAIGAMFRGTVGGRNMARPPWGWFDRNEEGRRQGEWFLTPAETIQRHFDLGEGFSTVYLHHPVLGVYRN